MMKPDHKKLLIAAGVLGFTGVAMGAFGAHGLRNILESAGQVKNWEKAVLYQLIHAVAIIGLVSTSRPLPAVNQIGWCWIAGVIGFSGSLYALALGGPSGVLWPITPLGGLALLTGWAWLVKSALRLPSE
jgi:uncharacterized membrane protein YgdD (TMEM256/DUF423 family)